MAEKEKQFEDSIEKPKFDSEAGLVCYTAKLTGDILPGLSAELTILKTKCLVSLQQHYLTQFLP